MNPNKALWEKGDFTEIAALMRQSGEAVVKSLGIPNDATSFVSQLLKISSSFMPPPPEGFVSPMTWGVDTHIIERFGQAGVPKENISMVKDTFYFISPDKSPTQLIESFRRFYGPTMSASIPATFLRVTVGL